MAVHVEQRRYLHPTSQMSIDMQPEPNLEGCIAAERAPERSENGFD